MAGHYAAEDYLPCSSNEGQRLRRPIRDGQLCLPAGGAPLDVVDLLSAAG